MNTAEELWQITSRGSLYAARERNKHTLHVSKHPCFTPSAWAFEDFCISVNQHVARRIKVEVSLALWY
ncbi:hypothetical protein Q8A67_012295 [Cirrhinus molitorella]|uniref:Uncharacterized protein n=1 Tax=Cirrhinus molitorella TaxID=172907 RepID=A0AA88PXV8_9TELE|nr:hypothetical protein Q8A67_012295 [Cirrhinus molitorella]